MKADKWVVSCSAALLLLIECAATTSAAPKASAAPGNAQITVLYDAFGKTSTMQKDWGYAAFIEYGGKRILFDTGNNPEMLAQNVKAKGVDLTKLDFVVMSHRHGDHMGGLTYLLKVNPTVKIYAPKEGFGVYGADLPSSFYRKDTSLPPEQQNLVSMWYSPRNIEIAFSHACLTHYGGIVVFNEFTRVMQLRGFLTRHEHFRQHTYQRICNLKQLAS